MSTKVTRDHIPHFHNLICTGILQCISTQRATRSSPFIQSHILRTALYGGGLLSFGKAIGKTTGWRYGRSCIQWFWFLMVWFSSTKQENGWWIKKWFDWKLIQSTLMCLSLPNLSHYSLWTTLQIHGYVIHENSWILLHTEWGKLFGDGA